MNQTKTYPGIFVYALNGYYEIVQNAYKVLLWLFNMARTYEEWWKTVPEDLKQKARKGDEGNKPLLNQVNYVLLHLHLAGKHDAKPSHDELKDWLHSGQVDVLRMNK